MEVAVRLEAFGGSADIIRRVRVPEGSWQTLTGLLEAVFYYGQNDVQPMPFRSVSVGDVIETADGGYRVMACGFARA